MHLIDLENHSLVTSHEVNVTQHLESTFYQALHTTDKMCFTVISSLSRCCTFLSASLSNRWTSLRFFSSMMLITLSKDSAILADITCWLSTMQSRVFLISTITFWMAGCFWRRQASSFSTPSWCSLWHLQVWWLGGWHVFYQRIQSRHTISLHLQQYTSKVWLGWRAQLTLLWRLGVPQEPLSALSAQTSFPSSSIIFATSSFRRFIWKATGNAPTPPSDKPVLFFFLWKIYVTNGQKATWITTNVIYEP